MSSSISTLLTRNLHDVFGENDPGVGARPSTRYSPKLACSTIPAGAFTVATTRSIASPARSRLLTLTFDISQLPGPRNWAMAGGSNGYRASLVRRQLTPGLISSSPGTAGLPPFISFSTSYPELNSAVRCPMLRIGNGGRDKAFSVTFFSEQAGLKRLLLQGMGGRGVYTDFCLCGLSAGG